MAASFIQVLKSYKIFFNAVLQFQSQSSDQDIIPLQPQNKNHFIVIVYIVESAIHQFFLYRKIYIQIYTFSTILSSVSLIKMEIIR